LREGQSLKGTMQTDHTHVTGYKIHTWTNVRSQCIFNFKNGKWFTARQCPVDI